jgi:hypothetical protein
LRVLTFKGRPFIIVIIISAANKRALYTQLNIYLWGACATRDVSPFTLTLKHI